MRTIYKIAFTFLFAFAFNSAIFGVQVLVKTTPLGDGITTTGFVRVVVKVTDKHIGRDLGIILHEETPYPLSWDSGIGLAMIENISGTVANTAQIRGFDGTGAGAWITASGTKDILKGDTIALWFAVDITNNTHGLTAQKTNETSPVTIYSNYISRAFLKGYTRNNAKYCTVFINDQTALSINGTGKNTVESIEILSDATIVSSIEAFNFNTLNATALPKNVAKSIISVYPTLVDDVLNIATTEELRSVKIYSLLGKVVYSGNEMTKIPVSSLKSGAYIVEATSINNTLARQSFLKK